MTQRVKFRLLYGQLLLVWLLPQWLWAQRIQLGAVLQTLCAGATVPVSFTVNEPFDAGNTFKIGLINQFDQVVATATDNVLPSGAFIQAPPSFSSSTFLTIRPALQAVISGSNNVLRGELSPVIITLNNTGPWSVSLNNSIYGLETLVINNSPFEYRVRPDATTTYTLLGVYNLQCGNGRVSGQAVLTTTNPLAVNPALPVSVQVLPNPTQGQVRVAGTLPTPRSVVIRLTDATSRTLQTHSPGLLPALSYDLDLSEYPVGVYIISVEADTQRTLFKVIKH